MDNGTFRNNISALIKSGIVELAFRFEPMYYTIHSKKFSRSITQDRMWAVINAVTRESPLRETPIYKLIVNPEMDRQRLQAIESL